MTSPFYQCCYTNASRVVDDRTSSGWQAVCVSPDIPPDAYKACVALLGANSSIRTNMVDERGGILNQFQISGDGNYLYLARTQYGLLDRVGRPNMFAHAFVFPLRDRAVLADPNHFLTVKRESFRDNEEEASQIPSELPRMPRWELEGALAAARLDAERYRQLIRCVFLQMAERKAPRPLYIRYDGTDQGLHALLYCIYSGLPYALRRRLSAVTATVNDVSGFNLVFTELAAERDYFIDPATGENNVLTARAQRRVERLGFVDYASLHCHGEDAGAYFERLEGMAQRLGDAGGENDLILKIAHQMLCEEGTDGLTDAELEGRLSDALRTRYSGSAEMERYIAGLLAEAYRRRLILTDESEQSLADWLANPVGAELAGAGERYQIHRFSTLSLPQAVEKLAGMSDSALAAYGRRLVREPGGAEILDHYYSSVPLSCEPVEWRTLREVWENSAFLPQRPRTGEAVCTRAWQLYCSELAEQGDAPGAYTRYLDLMRQLLPARELDACARAAKDEYWRQVRFAEISMEAVGEYQQFSVAGNDKCLQFSTFLRLTALGQEGARALLLGLNEFARRYLEALGEEPLVSAAGRLLRNLSLAEDGGEAWARLAVITGSESLFLALLDVRQAVAERRFEEACVRCHDARDSAADSGEHAVAEQAVELLAEECLRRDSDRRPVPLDMWLAVGSIAGGNAFAAVFDRVQPAILQREPAEVVADSGLLGKRRMVADGEAYVQTKAEAARAVRRWLSEWRQAEKRRQAEERRSMRPESGSLGGLLGKGLALFGRPGRAENAPQDGDAADKGESGLAERLPGDAPDEPSGGAEGVDDDRDAGKWSGSFGKK